MNTKLALSGLLLVATACGPDRPEGLYASLDAEDMASSDMAASDMGGQPSEPDMTTSTGALSGKWLLVHSQSTCVLGTEQLSTTDYIVDITQRGSVLTEQRKVCGIHLTPVLGTSVSIPRATIEAIDFIPVDQGLISSVKVGGGYTSSTELNLWGVTLEDPFHDALPTSGDDPRVLDTDGDGNPGVTFSISDGDCERYASQRQVFRYQGLLTSPTQIDGSSVGFSEGVVFGATRPFCRIAPALQPNDAHSLFRMVRIDGQGGGINADTDNDGQISCEEVNALAPMVMERRSADPTRCR